jgi:transmembrane sensor
VSGTESALANVGLVEAAASHWLERRHFSAWGDDERAAFDAWLAQSLSHEVAYLRLEAAWSRTERLAALRVPAPESASEPKQHRRAIFSGIAVAAFVGIVLAGSSAWFLLTQKQTVYATSLGGRQTVKLADGSQIDLNTDTVLRTTIDAHRRTVTLERGEAYFQIRHDATRPFVVMAAGNRITDLGTSFLIRKEPARLEVALIEGRASFESLNKTSQHPTVLASGDVVVATPDTVSLTKKSQRNFASDLGWRRGVLIFDYTTLADAAAEFNRYNRQKIVLADASLGRHTVVGTFPATNVELFGHIVQVILGLHVEEHKDEIVISR